MNYLKSLFFCFLIVFFANHILPGIEVSRVSKLPHFKADLLFPLCLGLVNSLIYPILKFFNQRVAWFHMAALALVLNFVVYAILKIFPIGIEIVTLEGYLSVSIVVSIGSFIMNYLEMRHCIHLNHLKPPENDDPGIPQ